VAEVMPGWLGVNRYFGDPWPSEVCERGTRRRTPVGELCWLCRDVVLYGQQGQWISQFSRAQDKQVEVPVHRECLLRQLVGNLAHLQQRCPCYGGSGGPEGTYREESLRVWSWLEERRFQVPAAAPAAKVH